MSRAALADPAPRRASPAPAAAPRQAVARPLDVRVLAPDDAWRSRLDKLAWALLGLGVVLRLGRYLLNFPFWGDELMFVQNLLDRGYTDLAEPLTLKQVAPLGYLAIELSAIKLFGFSEWSLRAFALVMSLAGLLIFRDLAARLLGKVPMLLAVGIFAMSYYPVRHAAECKPYGSDLTASLVLVWLAVCWWQSQANRRWLWGLIVAGPLGVAVSYPTAFVAGGVSVALAASVWQSRERRVWILFILYNALFVATFVVLLKLVTAGQYAATQDFMLDYWAEGFPPRAPWKLVAWLASLHAGEMMAYPVGDDHFGSILSLACFIVGVVVLVRRRERTIATLVLAPLALAFIAAAVHRYPYGGARLSQYYASLACLMIGLGAASLIAAIDRIEARRRVLVAAVAALFVIGAAMLARDMSHPYKRLVDFEHRGFARWFWKENADEGEVVCLHTDLGRNFYTPRTSEDYLCYERTYSAAHRHGGRHIDLAELSERLPAKRPLRLVMFALEGERRDETAYNAWLAEMGSRFDLTGEQSYRVRLNAPKEPDRFGRYMVLEFRAKSNGNATSSETAGRVTAPAGTR
jgi:hypothetical protein